VAYEGHHAYLFVGPAEAIVPGLRLDLAAAEIIHQKWVQFGVAESRELRSGQARQVAAAATRAYLLEFVSITHEAQQALLKVLEEPAERTSIFLVAPSADIFLPTLLSRLRVISLEPSARTAPEALARAAEFWQGAPEARLALIQKLLGESEEPAVLRAEATALVDALEFTRRGNAPATDEASFAQLRRARDYLRDRASSPRLILEHLALVL
jgi:DNA polymerase-3 subunit delta'